jgi:mycothiol synthase
MIAASTEKHTTAVSLPADYIMRPATMDDLKPVVALLNTCAQPAAGEGEYSEQETRNEWLEPDWPLEEHTRVVTSPQGEIIAYAEMWDPAPFVRKFFTIRVHPDHRDKDIDRVLFRWIKAHGESRIGLAPEGARVFLDTWFYAAEDARRALVEAAGFSLARHYYRMAVEMDEAPPSPTIPAGIAIRPIVPGQEERVAVRVYDEAFKDHWGHVDKPFEQVWQLWKHHLDNDETFDPALWFLALDGEQVVGVSLCWPYVGEQTDVGWVRTLAVLREHRRRGIGEALLRHSLRAFWERGTRKAGLGVDASNLTGAIRLYEKCGMRVILRIDFYRLVLREGEDLTTQSLEQDAGG